MLFLGWVGMQVGGNWEAIREQLRWADYVVAAALAGVAVYTFAKWRRGRRARIVAAAEPAQRAALDAEQET